MTTTRDRWDVTEAIASERRYQIRRWGYRSGDEFVEARHTVSEYVLFVRHYYGRVVMELSTKDGPKPAITMLRKVAALIVAYFEIERAVPITTLMIDKLPTVTAPAEFAKRVLGIGLRITDAEMLAAANDYDDQAGRMLLTVLAHCVSLFESFGVDRREDVLVLNGRDNLAA